MRLEFLSQVMVNFKAFRGRHEFLWDAPGLNFIRGENDLDKDLTANGASKSSIFDAFCWCLTGRTPLGLRNPDLVPWSGETPTKVGVPVLIDGKKHLIERSIGPNSLTWDGEDIDQDKLYTRLGLNFDLLTNTILLPQDCDLFFDRPPEKKMELFAEALELSRWDQRSDTAKERMGVAEGVAADLTTRKATLTASLAEIETLLREAKAIAESWAAKVRKNKRDRADEIRELEGSLEENENLLSTAKQKEESAAIELISLRSEMQTLQREFTPVLNELNRAEIRLEEAVLHRDAFSDELQELRHAKTCPTCGQKVRPENLKGHIEELERKLAIHKATIKTGIPAKTKSAVELFRQRIDSANGYIASFETQRESAQTTIDRLTPDVERLKAQLRELRRTNEDENNPYEDQIRTLQERKRTTEAELAGVAKDLSTASSKAERYRVWVRGFKDIKLQLVDEVLAELEIVTNSMLDEVGLTGWKVRYDIEKETKSGNIKRVFNVEIQSPRSRGFVKWESWSGGERQRLKLVGALALSDVLLAKSGVETNLEILDEPALYWSSDGVQDLCAFLSDRAKQNNRSIFYVEHQAAESAHFSRILTVIKDKKGAYIVEE